MKDKFILVIKGFIMGVANIIPGVSGGTLAITLGIYEKLINTISHFFKNLKDNIIYLACVGIGMVLSILLLSKGISYSLENYTLITKLFFIGLILGGVPLIYKKIKNQITLSNVIIFLISFGIVIAMTLTNAGNNEIVLTNLNIGGYLLLFLVGMITSATMVIPGISGSFVLMLLGYYQPILNTISDLTSFNNIWSDILILLPFGIGVIVGFVLVAKLIEYLFNKFEIKTYYGILGFILASIPCILIQKPELVITTSNLIIGIVLCLIGGFIAYKLGDR